MYTFLVSLSNFINGILAKFLWYNGPMHFHSAWHTNTVNKISPKISDLTGLNTSVPFHLNLICFAKLFPLVNFPRVEMFSTWLSGDDCRVQAVRVTLTADCPGTAHSTTLNFLTHSSFSVYVSQRDNPLIQQFDEWISNTYRSLDAIEEILWGVVITLHTKTVLQFIVPASLIG